ncbi:HNH endonuclease family protein [Mycobacteroides franklinii]|uniref:HNH endonuclease n=1 Tax=Mycobacteroides franklinii TaxID=948102 RepID=A0A4R5P4V7_9MYCO|nr:HNH endonuclease family protein [Mycobacteroides franklinii]TDH18106.1 HNH endonuclease [Mycobacteroides franklinii]
MKSRTLLIVAIAAAIAMVVAYQVSTRYRLQRANAIAGQSNMPTLAPGQDPLTGVAVVPKRVRSKDYQRSVFGDAWSDDTDAPGGHNGCDTRNDILSRDLGDKSFVYTRRCPQAVRTGTLLDPYTGVHVAFTRGPKSGEAVQIDHIVPLAYAWDMGARDWQPSMRWRFANDPANLIAVQGQANKDKGDQAPASWMPPNKAFWCQYSMQFAEVVRGYHLSIDERSANTIREAAHTCPQ